MKKGLLIIDRGSREKDASEELKIICEKVKTKGKYDFTDFCFLEVLPPFIKDGMQKVLSDSNNIETLTIVPYFLYPGKKVKNAVTDIMKYQKDTKIKFVVTKPMSMHQTLVDLVENRIISAVNDKQISLPKNEIDVLVIGHGSKDPNAQISLKYIVEGLLEKQYRNVNHCFLEIEQPNIAAGIQMCQKNKPKALVIVFYFLHKGIHVKTDIYQDLNPVLQEANLENVCITKHLGTDEKMIELIIERAREVENAD